MSDDGYGGGGGDDFDYDGPSGYVGRNIHKFDGDNE